MFEAISLSRDAVDAEEEAIRLRVRDLPDEQRREYHERLRRALKDPDTYATLNYFFLTGIHHMYLDKYGRGVLNLAVLLVGLACIFSGMPFIGMLIIGFILAVELMALFRSQVVVANHNNQVMKSILEELEPRF